MLPVSVFILDGLTQCFPWRFLLGGNKAGFVKVLLGTLQYPARVTHCKSTNSRLSETCSCSNMIHRTGRSNRGKRADKQFPIPIFQPLIVSHRGLNSTSHKFLNTEAWRGQDLNVHVKHNSILQSPVKVKKKKKNPHVCRFIYTSNIQIPKWPLIPGNFVQQI